MTVQHSSLQIDGELLPTPPAALTEEPSEDLRRLGEALKARAAKVGPTPAQVETPLPREEIPRDSACYLFRDALQEAS